MATRRPYLKRAESLVVAVRLALDTEGFTYRKWGGEQRCKAGDWIVANGDDTYTVDADTFAATYAPAAPGTYRKVAPVWAEEATTAGAITTKEGSTRYEAGDFLVYNDEEGEDGYAVSREKFLAMYAPAE